jgi:uridylate kinase
MNLAQGARRFTGLTYREALAAGVKVMDESAFVLANEHWLLMHVFDAAVADAMSAICVHADSAAAWHRTCGGSIAGRRCRGG